MSGRAGTASSFRVRDLQPADLTDVIRIDALHTGERKPEYWEAVFRDFIGRGGGRLRLGMAAEDDNEILGYLLGEVRAFEFGSEACGWIFGIGIDPDRLRSKVASGLLAAACRRFREAGVSRVRTMVLRNNVPVLSFFRANGFIAGSFVQLEVELEERA